MTYRKCRACDGYFPAMMHIRYCEGCRNRTKSQAWRLWRVTVSHYVLTEKIDFKDSNYYYERHDEFVIVKAPVINDVYVQVWKEFNKIPGIEYTISRIESLKDVA